MAQNPINSAAIPSVDLDAAALQAATEKLRTNATALWQRGADVKSAWSGLAHVYEAPESATLLSAMDPVATHTEKFSGDAYMVVSALNEFAAEAGPLVATLKKTKFDAAMFETRMRGKDDWDHDEKLVNENNDLVHAVNTTVVAFQAAERKAANAIENVIGGHTFHAMDPNSEHQDKYAYGFDSIPDDAKTPWGAKVEKKDGCFASTMTHIGHFFKGVGQGLWGMVKGVGLLVWNGLGAGGWEKFKQTWKGLGTMALMLNPALATAVWGPKGYADRMAAMGKSLVHWDEWKKDPSQAAGMVFADVITTVGTGGAGAGAKGAAVTGEVVETAGKLGKASEVAGDASKLSKAGGLTKAALTTLGKTVDPATYLRTLGKIPKIGQVMGGLKVKLTDLTGLGGKSPVDQMAVAGHGHAAAAGGEMGGKGLHDVTNTVKHPDPVPPVREPATVGGGGHEAGSAGSHPSAGGHDTGSGGSHPASHGGSSHPGGHDGPPTPHDGAPTPHDGAPGPHDGAPGPHDGAPGPHDGAPGPHDGAPGPHDGAPGPHDGAPGPHDGAPGPHDGTDGHRHYEGDPSHTYRDDGGRLHNSDTGKFVHDPRTHDGIDQHASLGVPHAHHVSDALAPEYTAKLTERTSAAQAHTTDLTARNEIIQRLEHDHGIKVDPRHLTNEGKIGTEVSRLASEADSPAARAEIARLDLSARAEIRSLAHLKSSSEELGMIAGRDVVAADGGHVIAGHAGELAGAGKLDTIGLSSDAHTLRIAENKGGSSTLGSRMVGPERVQQGTTAYLNELLHHDQRFVTYLHDHPQFAQQLARGEVHVQYDLVRALPGGGIKVQAFNIDLRGLRLDDLLAARVRAS